MFYNSAKNILYNFTFLVTVVANCKTNVEAIKALFANIFLTICHSFLANFYSPHDGIQHIIQLELIARYLLNLLEI